MRFTKMEGCGNDYIYVDGAKEKIDKDKKPELVRRLSDRHFGIGGDGVIFVNPGSKAEFEMEMYNADGSRAEMCGNGIRCVGKFVYDHGLTDKERVTIESFGKVKILDLTVKDGHVTSARVNMGAPILKPSEVPVDDSYLGDTDEDTFIAKPLTVKGHDYKITCVSMGNPHAVVFIDETDDIPDLDKMDIEAIGPYFENNEIFPNRTNVWERGTGETLACGTGCCACVVACILNGRTDDKVRVDVLGGTIYVEWDRNENLVYMTGPAVTVFEGEVEI